MIPKGNAVHEASIARSQTPSLSVTTDGAPWKALSWDAAEAARRVAHSVFAQEPSSVVTTSQLSLLRYYQPNHVAVYDPPLFVVSTMVPGIVCDHLVSNMYEEPRPPRRGSHRPELLSLEALSAESTRQLLPSLASHLKIHPVCREDLRRRPFSMLLQVTGNDETRPQPWPGQSFERTLNTFASSSKPMPTSLKSTPYQDPLCGEMPPAKKPRSATVSNLLAPPRASPLVGHCDGFPLEKSILESYARSAPQSISCQSLQKRCMYPSCTKISVSRGLCRGHGGGRRCHVPGCTKSAQSRSNFCWAHGGGQRCDAENCMRSRKSKRFCVAHLHMENGETSSAVQSPDKTKVASKPNGKCSAKAAEGLAKMNSRANSPLPHRALPSLGQALSSASRSPPNLPVRHTNEFCL